MDMQMLGFLGKLSSISSSLKNLTVHSTVDEVMPLLSHLGVQVDSNLVEGVLVTLKATATNPTDTLMEYVQNGGLLRALAGVSRAQIERQLEESEGVIQCPHCSELIFS